MSSNVSLYSLRINVSHAIHKALIHVSFEKKNHSGERENLYNILVEKYITEKVVIITNIGESFLCRFSRCDGW